MFERRSFARDLGSYLAHQLVEDLPRAARRRLGSIDWDRDVLNRAGLQRLSTARRGGNSVAFFVLGALAGGLAALLLAPKPGAELRSEVKHRAHDLIGSSREHAYPQAPARA
ncbi:MAG: YtxH domain-containing protein [Myxococcaceae bacterium]|nr:YtxH domain-containing protein [Myxococcaceae bacterium]MCI0671036.1 YtxH domain-containing protein [Myxococcaceae bacterium]